MFGLMLLLAGVLTPLLLWDNFGRDEDAQYFDALKQGTPTPESSTPAVAQTVGGDGLANPASVNCEEKGGASSNRENPLGQYGVCIFPDGRECEEWAMQYGDCPVGGIEITGYETEAARYCVITGGDYVVTVQSSATGEEQGNCIFRNGKKCDVQDLWAGKCSKNG